MHPLCRRLLYAENGIVSIARRTARTLSKPPRITSVKQVVTPGPEFQGNPGRLLGTTGFCIAVSGATFVGCVIWNYEKVRKSLKEKIAGLLPSLSSKNNESITEKIKSFWREQNHGKKLILTIITLNCIVFMMWQVRSLQPFMTKYFLSDPKARQLGVPMFLSMFSQIAPFHLLCNMYVLWSFSDAVMHMFGQEQFLFFYISAGLFSGLFSLTNKMFRGIPQPSLGASGAIIAALAAVCTAFPDSRLSIIFLPMYTFSADSAVKALLLFETLGVLLKWRFFDHAAHLAGILFGIWYVKYGHKITWAKREGVLQLWHRVRG
ncbi:presenilins-associated rhomboid-like protein, mitochondrial [Paramacrobiotus metropolitanus]|uniref:presenilins-associated rhomboid-like protein, mitochondrial n=1 Tax=Paramacrobiotus metropolitanus TaxID=2943436 RepID=UPI00244570AE|nr:presenilins-associated rhomboid-like protein, mitochondrial [Paramacrobiotus metropolitanus]